ncbi:Uncharacterised protein [Klebsiella pneumoniae]|nr:Uncharacterised protein [Klebsiella pneumoniae]
MANCLWIICRHLSVSVRVKKSKKLFANANVKKLR